MASWPERVAEDDHDSDTARHPASHFRTREGSRCDPWHDAVALHREMAYVPGDVTLWPSLTGGETIDLLGRTGGGVDKQRRDELVE